MSARNKKYAGKAVGPTEEEPLAPATPIDEGKTDVAAQFCLAEYATMMAKVHIWATFQYSGMSIVIVTLSLLAQLLKEIRPEVLLWAAAITVAAAYVAYQGAMLDGLQAVLYTETVLRPRAELLVGNPEVFGWERYLKRKRKLNPGQWAQWPALLSLAAGASLVAYRWPHFELADDVGCLAFLFLTSSVALLTRQGQALWGAINLATAENLEFATPAVEGRVQGKA